MRRQSYYSPEPGPAATASKRQLALFNANGVLTWQKTISETEAQVDMQQYPSGSYLLKIEHPKGAQTLRIVKE